MVNFTRIKSLLSVILLTLLALGTPQASAARVSALDLYNWTKSPPTFTRTGIDKYVAGLKARFEKYQGEQCYKIADDVGKICGSAAAFTCFRCLPCLTEQQFMEIHQGDASNFVLCHLGDCASRAVMWGGAGMIGYAVGVAAGLIGGKLRPNNSFDAFIFYMQDIEGIKGDHDGDVLMFDIETSY